MIKKISIAFIMFIFIKLLVSQVSDPFGSSVVYYGGTTISVKIQVNGHNASANSDVLIAYVNNEVRGKTTLTTLSNLVGGVGRTFMIQSNQDEEITHFKLWRFSEQAVYSTTTTVLSNPGGTIASGTNPLIINFNIRSYTVRGQATENQVGLPNVALNIMSVEPAFNTFLYLPYQTNSQGYYAIPDLSPGTNISFYAYSTTHTFNQNTHSLTNIQQDQIINFSADPLPVYMVSGFVIDSDLSPIPSVAIANTMTDNTGLYVVSVTQGQNVNLSPQKTGYTFLPPTITYNNVQNNIEQNFTGLIQTFTISGNTGTDNVQIAIQSNLNDLPANILSDSQGNYQINNVIFNDSIILTPQKEGYTFNPATENINNIQANITKNFAALPIMFTIDGYVNTNSRSAIEGVELKSGNTIMATTDASGYYSFDIQYGSDIDFYPVKAAYSFSPSSQQYLNVTSDKTQDFIGIPLPQYTISGIITENGIGIQGVSVDIGDIGQTLTDNTGFYTLTAYQTDITFSIIPTKTGFTFTPSNYMVNGLNSDLTRSFTASIQTFSVSGQVSSLPGTIVKAEWGSTVLQTVSNQTGNYSISGIPYGITFTLSAHKAGYSFTPPQYSISSIEDNLTGYNFTPEPITYPVTIHAIDFNGDNIADATVNFNSLFGTTNSNGVFVFIGNWGESYTVNVSKQGHFFINTPQTINSLDAAQTLTFTTRQPIQYTLEGVITNQNNSPLENVNVHVNQSIVLTNAAGYYSKSIFEGQSLVITPQLTGYTFTPSNHTISNVNANHEVDFTGNPNTYSLSGYVVKNQQGVPNVIILYNNSTIVTNQNGAFTIPVTHGQNIILSPELTGHTFNPPSISFTNITSNISNIVFNANPLAYTIHGQILVQGEVLEGVLVYDLNSDKEAYSGSNGQYIINTLYGDSVILAAYKELHSFTPEYHILANINENITNIDFEAIRHCADVSFNPPPALYYAPVSVTLSTQTPNTVIYYTTDGSEPNIASYVYNTPILVDYRSHLNLKAKAYKDTYIPSNTTEGFYRVTGTVQTPSISIPSGEYFETQLVVLSSEENAQIYYTLNSEIPTQEDYLYIRPIQIYENTIVKAKAFKENFIESSVNTAEYLIYHLIDFNLPDSIFINENSSLALDFKYYIDDSVEVDGDINLSYSISLINDPQNIQVEINNTNVRFIPNQYWFGREYLSFMVSYNNPDINRRTNLNHDIDSIKVIVNQISPQIIYYFPETDTVKLTDSNSQNFFINVAQQGQPLSYQWFVNDVNQNVNQNFFTYTFLNTQMYQVKVRIANSLSYNEKIWFVTSYVNDIEQVMPLYENKLYPNYPNPFNPETNIEFSLANDCFVNIDIYNLKGQLVQSLLNESLVKGKHALIWRSEKLPSGIYFISLNTNSYREVKKAVILK